MDLETVGPDVCKNIRHVIGTNRAGKLVRWIRLEPRRQ
jgi:hypothetical protein